MGVLNTVVRQSIKLGSPLRQSYSFHGYDIQQLVLQKLLEKAKSTDFGMYYQFKDILRHSDKIRAFQQSVPVTDYNLLFDEWWSKSLDGQKNVCWPGSVDFFALTSGTSAASSKQIPITSEMLQSIVRTSTQQFLSVADYTLPTSFYGKSVLMLGGSTDLKRVGNHLEGDLSGILASRLPLWFSTFYKPGKKIAFEKDWDKKLNAIAHKAPKWDVGIIAGVPSWIQLLFNRIVQYHNVNTIHEIWPNLQFYIHGGVYFEPYKKGFSGYLKEDIHYQETYLASEGFFAFQNGLRTKGMQLVLNNGIFYEFIPFNQENFNTDGSLKQNCKAYSLEDVRMEEEYALVVSTNAGAWRYLIGDTVKFTSLANYEIEITGRIRHFLSLCGEHLSIDNMNKAIQQLSLEFEIDILEFTVAGIVADDVFAHKWFVGINKKVDRTSLQLRLDQLLMELNDDYRTERQFALKLMSVKLVPNELFYDWMKLKGKEGGQHKFPRVLTTQQLKEWEEFLTKN